jgi:hypothetical protein
MKSNCLPPPIGIIRRHADSLFRLKSMARSHGIINSLLLLAIGLSCQAQSWQTVDDFQQNANPWTYGDSIVAGGPSNLVFAVGHVSSTNGVGISLAVRRSRDQGKTWETVDDSTAWSSERFEYLHAAISPTGTVVVAGMVRPDINSWGRWFVRLSADGGSTWATVDDFTYEPDSGGLPVAAAIAADGTIYVAGYATTYQGSQRLLIRRSADQGASWETVMDEDRSLGTSFGINGVFSMKLTHAGVFLTGVGYNMDSQGRIFSPWRVLRSTDQMASWQVVDDWLAPGSDECPARDIAEDARGNLVVVGSSRFYSANLNDWVVRRSADGGNTWAPVDEITNQYGPYGVAADSSGGLWATGTFSEYRTRVSHDGGATWADSDRFVYDVAGGAYSTPSGITSDGAGNIFVIGTGYHSGQKPHWILRKLAAVGPALSAARSGSALRLSWPASATGFVLQSATTLANGGDWQDSSLKATVVGDQSVVTVETAVPTGFFRLHKP